MDHSADNGGLTGTTNRGCPAAGCHAQIQDASEVTMGGIMLPEAAREKPIAGTVVAVGPGKREKDGTRKKPTVGS